MMKVTLKTRLTIIVYLSIVAESPPVAATIKYKGKSHAAFRMTKRRGVTLEEG